MEFSTCFLPSAIKRIAICAFASLGIVSGAFAQGSSGTGPVGDLTMVVQELAGGKVEFTLSGATTFKPTMPGSFSSTPVDFGDNFPAANTDMFEQIAIPEGMVLTVPDNAAMGGPSTKNLDLTQFEFSSAGTWRFRSIFSGTLNQGDAIVGSGSTITDKISFELLEPGTFVVQGFDFDMTYIVRSAAPADVKTRSSKKFPTTRVRRSSKKVKFRISNKGGLPVEGLRAKIKGKSSRDFRLRKRPKSTIPGGESTTMKISFRPRSAGNKRANVRITSNSATEKIKLKGRGVSE